MRQSSRTMRGEWAWFSASVISNTEARFTCRRRAPANLVRASRRVKARLVASAAAERDAASEPAGGSCHGHSDGAEPAATADAVGSDETDSESEESSPPDAPHARRPRANRGQASAAGASLRDIAAWHVIEEAILPRKSLGRIPTGRIAAASTKLAALKERGFAVKSRSRAGLSRAATEIVLHCARNQPIGATEDDFFHSVDEACRAAGLDMHGVRHADISSVVARRVRELDGSACTQPATPRAAGSSSSSS